MKESTLIYVCIHSLYFIFLKKSLLESSDLLYLCYLISVPANGSYLVI